MISLTCAPFGRFFTHGCISFWSRFTLLALSLVAAATAFPQHQHQVSTGESLRLGLAAGTEQGEEGGGKVTKVGVRANAVIALHCIAQRPTTAERLRRPG